MKMTHFLVKNLGRIDFDTGLDIQVKAREEILRGTGFPSIFILEHDPPVVTLGRHASEENITADKNLFKTNSFQVRRISRGGDVTVHEKGQMVIYTVLPFPSKKAGPLVKVLLQGLQKFCIQEFQLETEMPQDKPGLWCGSKKIASVGIDATSGVTMHGMAVNVCNDLFGFSLIRPCGMDVGMTSVAREKGRDIDFKECMERAVEFYRGEGSALLRPFIKK